MKKILMIMLSASLVVTSLFAQGKTETVSKDGKPSGEIVFFTNRTDRDTDGSFDKYIAEFNKEYPDVKVLVESSTDYRGELLTRIQTKEYGDVCMIDFNIDPTLFPSYFIPFGTTEELKDIYDEAFLYFGSYEGQQYGLPAFGGTGGFVYNKAVFEKAGITSIPKTPDELIDALRKIRDNTDAIPYYTNNASGWCLGFWGMMATNEASGDPLYANTKLPFEKDAFSKGHNLYEVSKLFYDIVSEKGLIEEDPTTTDWEASKGMLNRGEIGVMPLGLWAVAQMQAAGPNPQDVAIFPAPFVAEDGEQYAFVGGDLNYAINKHSKHPEAAKAWVDFMLKKSGFAQTEGSISIVKGDKMPEALDSYSDVNLVSTPKLEGGYITALADIQYDANIQLADSKIFSRIIEIATGFADETFDDYMSRLNKDWNAGVEKFTARFEK